MIEQLIGFVTSGGNQEINKCGFDGSIHFFKMNKVVQDIDFRIGEEKCNQFSFLLLGQYHVAALDGDAKKLLLELKRSQ